MRTELWHTRAPLIMAIVFGLLLVLPVMAQTPSPTVTPTAPSTETVELEEETPSATLAPSPTPLAELPTTEAAGQDRVSPPLQTELTVYNQNLGLVKEVRNLSLEEGINEIRYTDVAARIDPTSVHLMPLAQPEEITILEQNFEYDLVNREKLLHRYLDHEIRLVAENGQVYSGTLLSGSGDLILDTPNGLKVLSPGQVQEISLPSLPEGLITRPSLVWLLEASQTTTQDVRVTYLTEGINWKADYIAMLNASDTSLALDGWITIDNRSGATFRDAKLKLVAGDIHRVAPEPVPMVFEKEIARAAAPTPQVEERAFFEYHVYDVQRPVTVRDRQTKQIAFVQAPDVQVEKRYVLAGGPDIVPRAGQAISNPDYGIGERYNAKVTVRFKNSTESGLGIPLPKGTIRVYKEDRDGGAEFVGEDQIKHTPRDEEISLYLGDAFDVIGERRQTRFRQIGEQQIEESLEIQVRNHKEEAVLVHVIEHLFRAQDAQILESSEPFEQLDANTIEFELPVEADGEAQITYTVMYRW